MARSALVENPARTELRLLSLPCSSGEEPFSTHHLRYYSDYYRNPIYPTHDDAAAAAGIIKTGELRLCL